MEKHCALSVNKCLVGEVPSYFKDYFMLRSQSDNQHRCTRSSITDIFLPKFHLDVTKKSFYPCHMALWRDRHVFLRVPYGTLKMRLY